MTNKENNFAIVGLGASGLATFISLVDKCIHSTIENKAISIDIYEPNKSYGKGIAYSTESDNHILNMRSNTMSIRPEDPNDFVNFLQETYGDKYKDSEYITRKIFGKYLETRFHEAYEKAKKNGISVSLTKKQIESFTVNRDETITLHGKNVDNKNYQSAFFCIGNQPSTLFQDLKDTPNYYHSMWQKENDPAFKYSKGPALIIGTSLTAIDAYLSLREKGFKGEVVLASRHGLLPAIRPSHSSYDLKFLNEENIKKEVQNYPDKKLPLKKVKALFKKELEEAGVDLKYAFTKPKELLSLSPMENLQRNLDSLSNTNIVKTFSVLKAIDDVAKHIWKHMDEKSKKKFDKEHKTYWYVFDYPMPKPRAEELLALKEDFQIASGLRNLEYDEKNKSFSVQLKDQHSKKIVSRNFHTVINATGYGLDIEKMSSPILRNGLESGLIRPHKNGGIDVDFDTGKIISAHGTVLNGAYAIGSLTRGVHFYTNSLDENAKAATIAVKDAETKFLEKKNSNIHTLKVKKRPSIKEQILSKTESNTSLNNIDFGMLIKHGFLEDTRTLTQGAYNATAGELPYIPTTIGMKTLAETYVQLAKSELKKNNSSISYSVLFDPTPSHGDCEYSQDLYKKLTKRLSQELKAGETDFIILHGGHGSLLVRGKNEDGSINYLHLDSSTADGGLYKPATGIYETIQQFHENNKTTNYKIFANRDRIQVRTPGCHFFTLKYFYELVKTSLSLKDKGQELTNELASNVLTTKTEQAKHLLNQKEIMAESDSDNKKKLSHRLGIIKDIDNIHDMYHITPIKLPPEMAIAGESRSIFKQLEGSNNILEKELRKHLEFRNGKVQNKYHTNSTQEGLLIFTSILEKLKALKPEIEIRFENPVNLTSSDKKEIDTILNNTLLFHKAAKETKDNKSAYTLYAEAAR